METALYIFRTLLEASVATVTVTIGAFIVALVVGTLLTAIFTLSHRVSRWAIYTYVEILRNTPVLVQLFILYFGLGQIGFKLSPFTAASLGLGLNGSAIIFEILRSSLAAVPKGQSEAAAAVGMTRIQLLYYVVSPQAIRIAIPSIGNYCIGLIKDTSLASAVAVPELAFRARNLVSETFLSAQIYLLVAAFYFVLSFPLARAVAVLERKASSRRNQDAG